MNDERRKMLLGMVGGGIAAAALVRQAEAQDGGADRRPRRSPLTKAELNRIITQAVAKANSTNSPLRSITGRNRTTKMHIYVVDREGFILAGHNQEDAWVGSIDIAIAKARTAAFFSSNENALTSRIIGVLSQAHDTDGTDGAGPLWGIGNSNQGGTVGNHQNRNGLITFPGGWPLYKGARLVGAIGVSGDGVDQDEAVAAAGAVGFEPSSHVAQLGLTPPNV